MIKLIIFDLDGVLYDSKEYHFEALNNALGEVDQKYVISLKDHLNRFDGLPTSRKLEILSAEKGLPNSEHKNIWNRKQQITELLLKNISEDLETRKIIKKLKESNLKIVCCSNSIMSTIETVLKNLNIIDLFDKIYSNEDLINPKPHPKFTGRQ